MWPSASRADGDGLGLFAADPGEGARRRDAGALNEERGGRLVDAALDGAGVVPHRHAELAQGVQHAEIERDLLEAAAGDEADEGPFGQPVAEAGNVEPGGRHGREAALVERRQQGRDPPALESAGEAAPVPVPAIAEHHDGGVAGSWRGHVRQAKERERMALSMCPASKLSPDLSDVTVTLAGLNSMRSIA